MISNSSYYLFSLMSSLLELTNFKLLAVIVITYLSSLTLSFLKPRCECFGSYFHFTSSDDPVHSIAFDEMP